MLQALVRFRARRSRVVSQLIEAMEPRLLLSGLTEYPVATSQPFAVAVAADNTIWVGAAAGHNVTHLTNTGTLIQSYDVGPFGSVTDIAVAPDGNVWFVDIGNSVVGRLNPTTGVINDVTISSGLYANHIGIGTDGSVWYTDIATTTVGGFDSFDPNIGRIDPTTLAIDHVTNLGRLNTDATMITVKGDDIWVGLEGNENGDNVTPTFGNGAYAHISISSGTVTSYDAPIADRNSVSSILPMADGSLWMTLAQSANQDGNFPTQAQEGVYHVTFTGGVPNYTQNVQFDNTAGSHLPQNLVAAPNGTIYFLSVADKVINSINPTTLAITAATPTTGFPSSLVLGPSSTGTANGGLWFAEYDTDSVGVFDLPTVTVQPVVAAGVPQISQVQNVALPSTRVASFTGPGVATDYTATVNWGDGSPVVSGTISALSGGGFQVVAGGKVYANEGLYTVTVVITKTATTQSATATSQLKVTDTPLVLTSFSVTPLFLRITLLTATFTDDLTAVVGNFKVKINWGDGTTDSGATVKVSNGHFAIVDLHQYKKKGTFTVTLEVDPLAGISDPANPILATLHVTV